MKLSTTTRERRGKMGISSDGNLAYGIHFEGLSDLISEKMEKYVSESEEGYEEFENELLEKTGCQFSMYCSDTHPMYILTIPETVHVVPRGHVVLVNSFEVNPDWKSTLEKGVKFFTKKKKLPKDTQLGWLLTSYLG